MRSLIAGRHELQHEIGNTLWLFADRVVRMGGGLLLTVLIARRLGPREFGILSQAIAYTALFLPVSTLGLDALLVRDLARHPGHRDRLMGSAFILRIVGGVSATLLILASAAALYKGQPAFELIVVLSIVPVFQAADVIDLAFQSRVQASTVAIARISVFAVAAFARVYLLQTNASVAAFALITTVEAGLAAIALSVAYERAIGRLRAWKAESERIYRLLRDGWPMALSSMAVMIYMRIDIVMIEAMLGPGAAGIYSAAARISEVWYFIPVAVAASLAPSLARARIADPELYYARLAKLVRVLAVLSVGIAVVVTLLAEPISNLLYGPDYRGAGTILSLHIWASVFVAIGVAQSLWDINESLMRLSLYRTLSGAVVKVGLNLVLIGKFGVIGAATATIIAYAVSAFLLNALAPRTRPIFKLQLNALTPWYWFHGKQ